MSNEITRRSALQAGGIALATLGLASPQESPKSKPLRGKMLLKRGEPEVFTGDELKFIGMPVGGFFAGTVYLGGDGQLWNWDIFNQIRLGCVDRPNTLYMGDSLNAMSGANYVDPVKQQSPFKQEFKLIVEGANRRAVKFGDVRFRGEYPIGKVSYGASDADVEMELEAFSPFIPLDAASTSFPATTMTYTVKNVGKSVVNLSLIYSVENPVLVYSKKTRDDGAIIREATATNGVYFSASAKPMNKAVRKDMVFEDWSFGSYGNWTTTGTAFGKAPQKVSELPSYMGDVKAGTVYVVNTHQTKNGENVVAGDAHTGRLKSPSFAIQRKYINVRIGGGSHKGQTCVNLWVDGKVAASVTGRDSNEMRWESISVAGLEGKQAFLEVVDEATGGWGQVSLGEVIQSDSPGPLVPLEQLADFGSFCVEAVGNGSAMTPKMTDASVEVGKRLTLSPGQSETVTFVIAWHFPNCANNLPGKKHWYSTQWSDAKAVAKSLISQWELLQATTRTWNQTWYDSTLPYWFLDRTFVNISTLATTSCFRLDAGRYYFWEGVGCCPGTCSHVWGYAQAIGRLFPEIERYLREEIDYKIAYRKDTGAIDYRAEYHQAVATDGQAGCILRTYREHQMSKNSDFLRSIWPQVKGAMEYLIRQDKNQDGILDGAQYNTLDTAWYGEIAWISSLYIAALRASEAMAKEMGDAEFSAKCATLAASGSKRMVADLFDGEYFINKVDASHPEANNTNVGCHIDQLYGQSWAHQVGLPRVVPAAEAKKALKSLFKYSFYEDVWEYRRQNREIPGGRWYATPKEAGLIMCSFPKGGAGASAGKSGDAWAVGYFNECMTGFEYQAAHHMIDEGLVEEGLTIVRAIHERYHASKRNPYNEVECSDHYGRAMASYGAFISLTGFQCHGPKDTMTFNPKVSGTRVRFPFVNANGWGTCTIAGGKQTLNYRMTK